MGRSPNAKFQVCQNCNKPLTTEHLFAMYCFECQPIKRAAALEKAKHPKYVEKEIQPWPLEERFIEIRYSDVSMGITCPKCKRQIDYSPKMQEWELKCDKCKLKFWIETKVMVKNIL
jgi:Zn finger protein HypA/HybF involved in hydrogenase expression